VGHRAFPRLGFFYGERPDTFWGVSSSLIVEDNYQNMRLFAAPKANLFPNDRRTPDGESDGNQQGTLEILACHCAKRKAPHQMATGSMR
jgi:hypothetical protein